MAPLLEVTLPPKPSLGPLFLCREVFRHITMLTLIDLLMVPLTKRGRVFRRCRTVLCLRARKPGITPRREQGTGEDPTQPSTLTMTLTPKRPRTSDKRGCPDLFLFFAIPNLLTTVSPLTLLVTVNLQETPWKNPTG